MLNTQAAGVCQDGRLLAGEEVSVIHVCNMRFGVRAPGAHPVRIRFRKILYGQRDATILIALSQYRVYGATEYAGVAITNSPLGII